MTKAGKTLKGVLLLESRQRAQVYAKGHGIVSAMRDRFPAGTEESHFGTVEALIERIEASC